MQPAQQTMEKDEIPLTMVIKLTATTGATVCSAGGAKADYFSVLKKWAAAGNAAAHHLIRL